MPLQHGSKLVTLVLEHLQEWNCMGKLLYRMHSDGQVTVTSADTQCSFKTEQTHELKHGTLKMHTGNTTNSTSAISNLHLNSLNDT